MLGRGLGAVAPTTFVYVNDSSAPRDPDVVDKALGALDHVLDVVHDSVLRPIIVAARAVAYGLVVVVATLVAALVLVIALTRLMNIYLFAGHEYLTYAVLGSVSLVAGLIIWRRRRPRAAS